MDTLTIDQINEMVDKGQQEELFQQLLNEFNYNVDTCNRHPSYFAKLTLVRWARSGQDPKRMADALKEHLI